MSKKKKIYRVACEADLEAVLKVFKTLAKSSVKTKVIHIRVPTHAMSDILLKNVNLEFVNSELGDPNKFHVHVFIEKGDDYE